jgi:predicted metalloprotease with PDZ domain
LIQHHISLATTRRRTVTVEVVFDGAPGRLDVTFPVWTPGSYLIREHSRHIHEIAAVQGGRTVPIAKTAKNVYQLELAARGPVTLTYEVYAHELTVRTSHVDAGHAFLNPVGILPFLPGHERETQQLDIVDLPDGWDVACALPTERISRSVIRFTAADYDELIDSPLECGRHAASSERLAFEVRGVPHEIVLWGRSSLDRARFAADVCRIVEAQAAMFGGLPYRRYLFIALVSDSARGGLEHRASSALLFTRASITRAKGYEDLLSLVSHELFHAWNVKRIRPAAFAPYDLTRENHTRLLWAFEGLTSYYEDIFLVRAGLMSRARFLELLAERMTTLERTPGRRRLPVAEASYDAWIRYYRQDENSDNSGVSYYLKGSLVGVLLDLEIRRRTDGRRSLDDVLRLLWEEYGSQDRGVPEDGIEAACLRVGGDGLRPLLFEALHTTRDLPLSEALASVGLRVERRPAVSGDDRGGPAPAGQPLRCDIGIALRVDGDRVRVSTVRRGSPAEEAGVCPGDEIVAVDGLRADPASTSARLHDHSPGATVSITLFRRDELHHLSAVAGSPLLDTFSIVEPPESTQAVRAWLGDVS